MDWTLALAIQFGLLLTLLFSGLPVVFAFFAANVIGAWIFLGGTAGLQLLIRNAFDGVTSFSLVPIPLFILMGEVLFHSGIGTRAIDAVDRLIRGVPGRLSIVAIASGTIFAALSGSSVANTAMLGSTLLPDMRARGYKPVVSLGPILATGGIAVLIPPSGMAVLLGSLANISIIDILIGGILPGLLLAATFVVYVLVRCTLDPTLAPTYPLERMSARERILPFVANVLPLSILVLAVIGTMLGGIASPNEASAFGAIGAILIALPYRALSWRVLVVSLRETARISGMILFILAASTTYSQILTFSGATQGLLGVLRGFELGPYGFFLMVVITLLVLGCFVDQLSMMLITLPFFVPLAQQLGVDTVWLAVVMLVMLEVALITPPFGVMLFVMKGVAPPDVTLAEITLSAVPYIVLTLLVVAAVIAFPALATWLPGLAR